MTDITVTLGPRSDLDPDEKRQRALRAAEVLGSAGWVFDEVISALTQEMLGRDAPHEKEKREELFQQIKATAHLKGHLQFIVKQKAAEEAIHERKHRNDPPADAE